MKTAFFFTFVALLARLCLAIPPGCLLHAVNTQDEPSNLSAVCGNGALNVQSYMADNCGNFEETAQKAFIDTCSSAGTSVAAYTATSTSNSTGSSTGTATGLITSTSAHTTGSHSSSASGSSISSTAGANVNNRQAALGPMAAAAVALIGAVAAL